MSAVRPRARCRDEIVEALFTLRALARSLANARRVALLCVALRCVAPRCGGDAMRCDAEPRCTARRTALEIASS